MMYPHHLQCKVTKSKAPFILNLICYRGKNKVAFIFSNENVLGLTKCFAIDDDVEKHTSRSQGYR